MRSALMGSLQITCFFDRGPFWVFPLTSFYLTKSARAYFFPKSVNMYYFRSGPMSVYPIWPQSKGGEGPDERRLDEGAGQGADEADAARPEARPAAERGHSEGGMMRLETLIELNSFL